MCHGSQILRRITLRKSVMLPPCGDDSFAHATVLPVRASSVLSLAVTVSNVQNVK